MTAAAATADGSHRIGGSGDDSATDLHVDSSGMRVTVVGFTESADFPVSSGVAHAGSKDAFGHVQLGGVAPVLSNIINHRLGYKYHYAVADYLQRSARHIASATAVEKAYALGEAAVEFALAGKNAVMPCIVRGRGKRYSWSIGEAKLEDIANVEKKMPRNYITRDGFGITEAGREYFAPLIAGEAYPEYKNGLPKYVTLKNQLVPRKLKKRFKI